MRKYLKPAIEMEAFEVKDFIMDDSDPSEILESEEVAAAAPISAVDFN